MPAMRRTQQAHARLARELKKLGAELPHELSPKTLDQLPSQLHMHVLSFLNPPELAALALTSEHWAKRILPLVNTLRFWHPQGDARIWHWGLTQTSFFSNAVELLSCLCVRAGPEQFIQLILDMTPPLEATPLLLGSMPANPIGVLDCLSIWTSVVVAALRRNLHRSIPTLIYSL